MSCSDDFNRVVLSKIPDVEHSDYVNASYVDVSKSIEYDDIILNFSFQNGELNFKRAKYFLQNNFFIKL